MQKVMMGPPIRCRPVCTATGAACILSSIFGKIMTLYPLGQEGRCAGAGAGTAHCSAIR